MGYYFFRQHHIYFKVLQLFRTNQFVVNILLLFYVTLLWFSSFIMTPAVSSVQGGVLGELLLSWIDKTSIFTTIVAIVLVFVQSFLINLLVSRYRMASELSLFPGVFYVLLTSCIPDFLYLSPILIANTFLLLAFYELFDTYRKHSTAAKIFNVGFFLGLASLTYFSYVLFLLLAILGLNILRAFRWKEIIILIIGFVVPYFLGGTIAFLTENWDYFWQIQFVPSFQFLNFTGVAGWELYVKLSFFAILLFMVILSYGTYTLKKNIRIQKYISIFYWSILIGGLSLLIQHPISLVHLLVIVPPVAVFMSFSFLKFSKSTAEALHLVLLIAILLLQYKSFFLT